jgi:hypothetical protein
MLNDDDCEDWTASRLVALLPWAEDCGQPQKSFEARAVHL